MSTPQAHLGLHPRQVLMDGQASAMVLPVVDHYCGTEARMRKSIALQQQLLAEFGTNVMDVTLDCEDGAPAGQEVAQAQLIVEVLHEANRMFGLSGEGNANALRLGLRVHDVNHPSFTDDLQIILPQAGGLLSYVMVPKVDSVSDVEKALQTMRELGDGRNNTSPIPLHVLVESPKAVHNAFDIAAHPRVQSISFGLMDFVSAHAGAIPASAMTAEGQFEHPLVVRAKLAIASACHAHGKTPSHCVVTEFKDLDKLGRAAVQASQNLGYTRMWSIHPDQIRPILQAFAPSADVVHTAADLLLAAAKANWAPISYDHVLHDRASYRYYWQVLERAVATGQALPAQAALWFDGKHSL